MKKNKERLHLGSFSARLVSEDGCVQVIVKLPNSCFTCARTWAFGREIVVLLLSVLSRVRNSLALQGGGASYRHPRSSGTASGRLMPTSFRPMSTSTRRATPIKKLFALDR